MPIPTETLLFFEQYFGEQIRAHGFVRYDSEVPLQWYRLVNDEVLLILCIFPISHMPQYDFQLRYGAAPLFQTRDCIPLKRSYSYDLRMKDGTVVGEVWPPVPIDKLGSYQVFENPFSTEHEYGGIIPYEYTLEQYKYQMDTIFHHFERITDIKSAYEWYCLYRGVGLQDALKSCSPDERETVERKYRFRDYDELAYLGLYDDFHYLVEHSYLKSACERFFEPHGSWRFVLSARNPNARIVKFTYEKFLRVMEAAKSREAFEAYWETLPAELAQEAARLKKRLKLP